MAFITYSIPRDELIVLIEFLAESRDHLEGIEEKVLKMEISKDKELINSIFRPIHTIKGTCSFLGLEHIGRLSHELETLLDDVRKGRIEVIDSDIIDVILEAVDTVSRMLENTSNAVEGMDQSAEIIDTEIEDVPYEDILNRVREVRANKTGAPEEAPAAREEAPAARDKAAEGDAECETGEQQFVAPTGLKFPGEMKLQFEVEGLDQVAKIENAVLALEQKPASFELYNQIFRALHTLKGNTGIILSTIDDEEVRNNHYLNRFRQLSHTAESLVQKRRDRKQKLQMEELDLLLSAADCFKHFLEAFKEDIAPARRICPLLEQFDQLEAASDVGVLGGGELKDIGGDSLAEAVSNSLDQLLDAIGAGLEEITHRAQRSGGIRKLKRSYRNLEKVAQRIGHNWLVEKSKNGINLVSFMQQGSDPNEEAFIGNLTGDYKEMRAKADRRANRELPDRRKATLPPPTADKELEVRVGEKVLKVSQEKIDIFMNLIGELLVSKNNLLAFEREVSMSYDLPEIARRLKTSADTIARISNQLQTHVMEIRMLPVASAFSRFPRMIRDLSKKLEKKMRLLISGEDTEVDKNVIEALTDPLVHMVRNAADHGMETPKERAAKGKPEEGTIRLSAFNQGQFVVIQISDDGRGMDTKKIGMKALEKGLVQPEELEKMDPARVLNLIFLPGFSMAKEISDVSGRGVGMDVVRDNIEKLGGESHIESTLDKGSTFTIKLPLTMAIGRGLEVEACSNRYYVPLESIIETLRIAPDSLFRYKGKEMTVIRDELIPVYRLQSQLGLEHTNGRLMSGKKNEAMVILNVKGRKLGMVVDDFYNESEYVIKPLAGSIANIEGISGAMITGEGKVNLILDLLRLF